MRYNVENQRLWSGMRRAAEYFDTDMGGLNKYLCLADGTLEMMEEYGIVPEGELLLRIVRFLGMTSGEIIFDREPEAGLETPRHIPGFGGEGRAELLGRVMVDLPPDDDREYVGLTVRDSSMSRAGIMEGDLAVIRRQAVAEDGDIVAAEVDGITVVRRFRRRGLLSWLEAEGYVGGESDVSGMTSSGPRVTIWGKVVSSIRSYE